MSGWSVRAKLLTFALAVITHSPVFTWLGTFRDNPVGAPPLTQEPVKAGASFDYRFMPPDAGTFWYHATPAQTARGLAGLLIVEETAPVEVSFSTNPHVRPLVTGQFGPEPHPIVPPATTYPPSFVGWSETPIE